MRPVHPTAGHQPVRIGARLRASRLAQGLTLEQLAAATQVTKGFLSRVERDDTQPSLTSLVQICEALSLPIGSLFEAPDVQRLPLDDAPRINMGGRGADERLVTPRSEERLQVIHSTLAPDADGGDELYTVNCSVEVLHLITGELTVTFNDRIEELASGDTLTFPGNTPHNWRAGPRGATTVWTLVPAAWSGAG